MSTRGSDAASGQRTAAGAPPRPGTAPRPAHGDDLGLEPELAWSRWADLDAATADGLLRLRATAPSVGGGAGASASAGAGANVVPATEPVDLDDGTEHLWIPDDSGPVAYLRLRARPPAERGTDGPGAVVERWCVRADVRQLGLGSALVADVVARHGGSTLVADVPAEATDAFTRFGFVAVATVQEATPPAVPLTRLRRAPDAPWREA
ncbi:MAG: GNAT family N-acetyltransferase [Kineosporiaceae bacterium]